LLFSQKGVVDSVVFLRVQQNHWAPELGVVGTLTDLMLHEPSLEINGAAHIEGTVGTFENVHVRHAVSMEQTQKCRGVIST
jgi:hypothetical protein